MWVASPELYLCQHLYHSLQSHRASNALPTSQKNVRTEVLTNLQESQLPRSA